MIETFVYFIQGGPESLIKIGLSNRPARRLIECQLGCPVPLDLVAVMEGDFRTELELHKRFGAANIHGEWFWPSVGLVDLIREINPDSRVLNATASWEEHKKKKWEGMCRCSMALEGHPPGYKHDFGPPPDTPEP